MNQELTARAAETGVVPAGYAEKAMATLLQLHTEIMDEKERRVDLYRRLMEKEQSVAELKMYVKLLEERLGQRTVRKAPRPPPPPPRVISLRVPPRPEPVASAPQEVPVDAKPAQVTPLRPMTKPLPPPPPPAREQTPRRRRSANDGWKSW